MAFISKFDLLEIVVDLSVIVTAINYIALVSVIYNVYLLCIFRELQGQM